MVIPYEIRNLVYGFAGLSFVPSRSKCGACEGAGTADRLGSDIVRGGFVMVDPSVRRLLVRV